MRDVESYLSQNEGDRKEKRTFIMMLVGKVSTREINAQFGGYFDDYPENDDGGSYS